MYKYVFIYKLSMSPLLNFSFSPRLWRPRGYSNILTNASEKRFRIPLRIPYVVTAAPQPRALAISSARQGVRKMYS